MTESQIWRYDQGNWSRVPDPIQWENGDDTIEVLEREGFTQSTSLGFPDGSCSITIRSTTRGDEYWRVDLEIGYVAYEIEVSGLPNLVDLISKLSPFATAGILDSVSSELAPLILKAGANARRAAPGAL